MSSNSTQPMAIQLIRTVLQLIDEPFCSCKQNTQDGLFFVAWSRSSTAFGSLESMEKISNPIALSSWAPANSSSATLSLELSAIPRPSAPAPPGVVTAVNDNVA